MKTSFNFFSLSLLLFALLVFVSCGGGGGGGGAVAPPGGGGGGLSTSSINIVGDVSVKEADKALSFGLTTTSNTAINYNWTITDTGLTNFADFTVDFRNSGSGVLGGPADSDKQATVDFFIVDDNLFEDNEEFTFTITSGGSANSAIGSIIDNDMNRKPSISLALVDASTAIEGGGQVFEVHLDQKSGTHTTFDWGLVASTDANGVALPGAVQAADFSATSLPTGKVEIRAGQTSEMIFLPLSKIDDGYEGDEKFQLVLTDIIGAVETTTADSGSIMDNDPKPKLVVLNSYTDLSADLSIATVLVSGFSSTETLFLWDATGTAKGVLADDTGVLSIPAGETTVIITIPQKSNNDITGDIELTFRHVRGLVDEVIGIDNRPITSTNPIEGTIINYDAISDRVYYFADSFSDPKTEGEDFSIEVKLNRVDSAITDKIRWVLLDQAMMPLVATTDFEAISGEVIFDPSGTGFINIQSKDDNIYEGAENYIVRLVDLAPISGGAKRVQPFSHVIRLMDKQTQPVLLFERVLDQIVDEGQSVKSRLTLSSVSEQTVDVDWRVYQANVDGVNSFEFEDEDFSVNSLSGRVSFGPGATTQDISITTIDDDVFEVDERYQLRITGVTNVSLATGALVARGAITDNDAIPTLSLVNVAASEAGNSSDSNILKLSAISGREITFLWDLLPDDTATNDFDDNDFQRIRGRGSIAAGDSTTAIELIAVDDAIYEKDESFILSINNIVGAVDASANSSLTQNSKVYDNDAKPQLSLTDVAGSEEQGKITLQAQLDRPSKFDIGIIYSTTTDTRVGATPAIANVDYTAVSNEVVIISAGNTTADIDIVIHNDIMAEPNESFAVVIELSPNTEVSIIDSNAQVIPKLTVYGTIIDDLLKVSPVSEDATSGSITFTPNTTTNNEQFTWEITFTDATNSASGADFVAITGVLTVIGDTNTVGAEFNIVDDRIYEGGVGSYEVFGVTIFNQEGQIILVASNLEVGDNDETPKIQFSRLFTDNAGYEQTKKTILEFTLEPESKFDIGISYSTKEAVGNESRFSPAQEVVDYEGTTDVLVIIPAGSTAGGIEIPIVDDTIAELDEYFFVVVSLTPTSDAVLSSVGGVSLELKLTALILNEDGLLGQITISGASEDNKQGTITFTKSNANGDRVSNVAWEIIFPDATNSAERADFGKIISGDFDSYPAVGSIAPREAFFDITNDTLYEGNESFTVKITENNLNSDININVISNVITKEFSLAEDEAQPKLNLPKTVAELEEQGSVTFQAKLDTISKFDVGIIYSTTTDRRKGINTATAGEDYISTTDSSIVILAGHTTADIKIPILPDTIPELKESFAVVIGLTPTSDVSFDALKVYAMIENDDGLLGDVAVSRAEEVFGTGEITFTPSNTTTTTQQLTWEIAFTNTPNSAGQADFGLALTGEFKELSAGVSEDRSAEFEIINDNIYESSEQFTITIKEGNRELVTKTFTLEDNDAQPVLTVTGLPQSEENRQIMFDVELDRASKFDITYNYQTISGSATSPDDYTSTPVSGLDRTISPGALTDSFTIAIVDDNALEGIETFQVAITLKEPNNQAIVNDNSKEILATINDNDQGILTALLAGTQIEQLAEGEGNYTIRLTDPENASFPPETYTLVVTGGDPQPATTTDYNIITASHSITTAASSIDFTIAISDDSIYEGNEFILIKVTDSKNAPLAESLFTITDNENEPSVGIQRISASDITEGAGIDYRVTLSSQIPSAASVGWQITAVSTTGNDFETSLSGVVSFAALVETANINIQIANDEIYEGDEDFIISLQNPSVNISAGISQQAQQVTSTITDSADFPVLLGVTSTTFEESEPGQRDVAVEFDHSTDISITGIFEVSPFGNGAASDDLASSEIPFTLTSGNKTTITIDINDDNIFELKEEFKVTKIKAVTSSFDNLADTDFMPSGSYNASFFIATSDITELEITGPATINEGETADYTLSITNGVVYPLNPIKIGLAFANITSPMADISDDISNDVNSVSIEKNEASVTISIPIRDDTKAENLETFSVTITDITTDFYGQEVSLLPNARISTLETQIALSDPPTPRISFSDTRTLVRNDTQVLDITIGVSPDAIEGLEISATLFIEQLSGSTNVNDINNDDFQLQNSSSLREYSLSSGMQQISIYQGTFSSSPINLFPEAIELFALSIEKLSGTWHGEPIGFVTEGSTGAGGVGEGAQLNIWVGAHDLTAQFAKLTTQPEEISRYLKKQPPGPRKISLYEGDTYSLRVDHSEFVQSTIGTVLLDIDFSTDTGSMIDDDISISGSELVEEDDDYRLKILHNKRHTDFNISVKTDQSQEEEENFTITLNRVLVRSSTSFGGESIADFSYDNTIGKSNSVTITVLPTLDGDGDGLIDIRNITMLHNMRYNLAGTNYKTSVEDPGKECSPNPCHGYELYNDLDFSSDKEFPTQWRKLPSGSLVDSLNSVDDYDTTPDEKVRTTNSIGIGWVPVGSSMAPFTGIFEGNGKTISNLDIDLATSDAIYGAELGLFGAISSAAQVRNIGLIDMRIYYDGAYKGEITNSEIVIGPLVATQLGGTIAASYVIGTINGGVATNAIGGLVGQQKHLAPSSSPQIIASYAKVEVSSDVGVNNILGGLVGRQDIGNITASYATGDIYGSGVDINSNNNNTLGGLVGLQSGGNITVSYAIGDVNDASGSQVITKGGKLVGSGSSGGIIDSYGFGKVLNVGTTSPLGTHPSAQNAAELVELDLLRQDIFNAWNFHPDQMRRPFLNYADYDQNSDTYTCQDTTSTTDIFIVNCASGPELIDNQ